MNFISVIKKHYSLILQYFLVVVAFVFMVIIGSRFASSIVNNHLVTYGREVISASVETLETYFDGHRVTFGNIVYIIEELYNQNIGLQEIEQEIVRWNNRLLANQERYQDFVYISGVIDGKFVQGIPRVIPDDYRPETRPWYIGAFEHEGQTHIGNPYLGLLSGYWLMALSTVMHDADGNPFGVLALDVRISTIAEYVNNMRLMNHGYGVLLDSELTVIANPDETNFGVKLEDVDNQKGGMKVLSNMLSENSDMDAYHYISVYGIDSVLFSRGLSNGWYVYVSSPTSDYYKDVNVMLVVLLFAAAISILVVCSFLTILYRARIRSDASNKFKSSFLANMSHEIRTPMNAIIGMSDLLLNSNPTEGKKITKRDIDCVQDINTSAHSLLAIINGILDLSKIEAGKMTLNPGHYDFYMLIDNVVSMFTFVSKKKGLLFKVENDEKMPRFLYGDDIKLRQVLINVLGNAVKYTSKGFISLHITTSLENKKIWFEIQDSGFGVRKEDIPVLFSAFEQVKDQKNRNIVGTGLGLPISKAFVEMMGGTITLESDYGMGSVFNIIIPIEEGDESKVSSDSGSFKAQALSAPEAKVLVVDDNEFNLKVAVGLLELFDINADTAISGEESLDMIVDTDYDIVFMDHMMPDMDGLEATAQIRKLLEEKKETRRLPIIALTANAVQGSREMFLEHDMDDFLSKPIEMPILARILSEWLPPEKITIKHDVDVPDNKTENAKSADTDDIWEKINTISEIDAETGLRRLSGRKDMYQNNLKLFQERIDAHNEKMAALLSSGDIKNFSITVHAIKSALASIGAEQLSSIAFNLESASKGDDAEYCKQHFPLFSQRIAVLSKALKKALNPGGEAAEGKKSFASEADAAAFLKEKVQLTLEAIDDFDSDAGLAALDDALACKYDDKTTKLLESAAAELKRFKYNEAKDILEKLG